MCGWGWNGEKDEELLFSAFCHRGETYMNKKLSRSYQSFIGLRLEAQSPELVSSEEQESFLSSAKVFSGKVLNGAEH